MHVRGGGAKGCRFRRRILQCWKGQGAMDSRCGCGRGRRAVLLLLLAALLLQGWAGHGQCAGVVRAQRTAGAGAERGGAAWERRRAAEEVDRAPDWADVTVERFVGRLVAGMEEIQTALREIRQLWDPEGKYGEEFFEKFVLSPAVNDVFLAKHMHRILRSAEIEAERERREGGTSGGGQSSSGVRHLFSVAKNLFGLGGGGGYPPREPVGERAKARADAQDEQHHSRHHHYHHHRHRHHARQLRGDTQSLFSGSAAASQRYLQPQLHKHEHEHVMDRFPPAHQRVVFVWQGTSVTAGHDNLYANAYPFVVDRRLQRAYRSLGLELETRNVALGNNNCQPYDACIGTFAGTGADVLVWEHGMNCGRAQTGLSVPTMVLQARHHAELPITMFGFFPLWVSAFKKTQEPKSRERELFDKYKYDGFLFFEGYGLRRPLEDDYKMLQRDYMLSVKARPGGKWHPGSHGHALRGDLMAFNFLKMLEHSLRKLHEETHRLARVPTPHDLGFEVFSASVGHGNLTWGEDFHIGSTGTVTHTSPPYLKCPYRGSTGALLCSPHLQCHTGFVPKYDENMDLSHLIEGLPASFNATKIRENPEHINGYSVSEAAHAASGSGGGTTAGAPPRWTYMVFPSDQGVVKGVRQFGIRDEKWVWVGNKQAGPITFRITTHERGPVVLCSCQAPWGHYPKRHTTLHEGATIVVDGNTPGKLSTVTEFRDSLCVEVQDALAPGEHRITVTAKEDDVAVNVAHILHV